jgi:hypothetical protein
VTEVPLGGGWRVAGVVRVGDTVRRPPAFATQLTRDFLVHLERVGFDELGRDILSWIDGETYSDCRAIVWSDEQPASSARLLSRYTKRWHRLRWRRARRSSATATSVRGT